MEDLTHDEKRLARDELLTCIVRSGGMAKDIRFPAHCRGRYNTRVHELHRIYVKLGGRLSTDEILR